MNLPVLHISYNWNNMIFVLLHLAYFTFFKALLFCSLHHNFFLSVAEKYSIVCTYYMSFIYSSVDGHGVVFMFWLLWIMLLWTLVYKYLFEPLFSDLLDIYSVVELLGHMVIFWNHQIVYHSGCTILHSHQQYTRVPNSHGMLL